MKVIYTFAQTIFYYTHKIRYVAKGGVNDGRRIPWWRICVNRCIVHLINYRRSSLHL